MELLSHTSSRENLENQLVNAALQNGIDGINVDFEQIPTDVGDHYIQFIRELSVLCRVNNLVLSVDNYVPKGYNTHYHREEQGVMADYVIIMGYDEHYAGSESGSVASIGFVEDGIKKALKSVPADKLVNAVPFYTRIWTTTDGNTTSRAVGMQAAVDQLNSDGQVALWNDDCGQYVASYTVGNATRQIWFEEEKSIEAKMQVIQENNVAGVAGWKLGLEKSSVWPVISKYNK